MRPNMPIQSREQTLQPSTIKHQKGKKRNKEREENIQLSAKQDLGKSKNK
jgi:hypothetical protein